MYGLVSAKGPQLGIGIKVNGSQVLVDLWRRTFLFIFQKALAIQR